jgi:hypothetical protein
MGFLSLNMQASGPEFRIIIVGFSARKVGFSARKGDNSAAKVSFQCSEYIIGFSFRTQTHGMQKLDVKPLRVGLTGGFHSDKKEKKIFLIYKEIQMGAVAKSYTCMRKGFLIYEEMSKYLVIYEEDVSHK